MSELAYLACEEVRSQGPTEQLNGMGKGRHVSFANEG